MSTVLDADPVVLDGLEFDAPCIVADHGEHAAEAALRCRKCGAAGLYCTPHLVKLRDKFDAYMRRNRDGKMVCTTCNAEARSFDALVEVVPL